MEKRTSQELTPYGDNQSARGYLATPEAGEGPGVLVLHAWWGLNDTMRTVCTRLAEAGFVAFAPDLYHGKLADTIADAETLGKALDANHLQAKAEIADATRFLGERASHAEGGLAVIGFSLGAYYALDLAAAAPEQVSSVVIFYGTGDDDFSNSRAAYLGHFAENDPYEPQSNVDDLEQSLLRAGRQVTFYRYPGTGHWFFEPDRSQAYNQAAASLAWNRTLAFLRGRYERNDKELNTVELDLGLLEHGPHANLIRDMARKCYADQTVQAIWVGGSLAAGTGDVYSDVDFRIAVEPGQIDRWTSPDWEQYLPMRVYGGLFMRFGEQALLHHLVMADGTIVDFYVQDTTKQNLEPKLVILACRNAEFREALEGFASPAASLAREIDGAVVRQFLVDYWITTHKEIKGLGRKYDHFAFAGLFFERIALLRAWYMQAAGKDIDSRITIHVLGAMHKGLDGKLTTDQHNILGLPSRTPEENVIAIDAIRAEMARVGRWLADRHEFAYPHELEDMVNRIWNENKESLTRR
jgi:carboxymethylenebutenolidase